MVKKFEFFPDVDPEFAEGDIIISCRRPYRIQVVQQDGLVWTGTDWAVQSVYGLELCQEFILAKHFKQYRPVVTFSEAVWKLRRSTNV